MQQYKAVTGVVLIYLKGYVKNRLDGQEVFPQYLELELVLLRLDFERFRVCGRPYASRGALGLSRRPYSDRCEKLIYMRYEGEALKPNLRTNDATCATSTESFSKT
jgi:hypothetical protein